MNIFPTFKNDVRGSNVHRQSSIIWHTRHLRDVRFRAITVSQSSFSEHDVATSRHVVASLLVQQHGKAFFTA